MIKAILTDIEGTTSSLAFVKDVLFPYARAHMAEFIHAHAHEPVVRAQLDEVSRLAGRALTIEEAIAQLISWIDADKKITPLKTLQGMIWEAGYKQGDYQGHMYEDAVRWLRRWKEQGLRLYVFSSGSVLAQKLLFGHTAWGDMTPLFSGYFDTTVGAKRNPAAYRAITGQIGLPATDILFLSDIHEELDAAREAGMRTTQVLREGVTPAVDHPRARSFDDIIV
jgi:enolase-phosphatase E1